MKSPETFRAKKGCGAAPGARRNPAPRGGKSGRRGETKNRPPLSRPAKIK